MVPALKGLMSHLATFIEMNRAEYITLCSYVTSAEILHFVCASLLYMIYKTAMFSVHFVYYTTYYTASWMANEHRKYIYFIL